MSSPQDLRAERDVELREELLADADVRRAMKAIEEQTSKMQTRRSLLASAVRLSRELAPQLHRTVSTCRERLGYDVPTELYVYSSPQFNAAAARPEDGRAFILFSSSLLEAFDDQELAFVVGHELGHHVYGHHEIPVGLLARAPIPPALALSLFTWSRYAEISADRAGLHCCQDLQSVGRCLFKLASGLREPLTTSVIDAMLAQMDEIEATGIAKGDDAPRQDWISTHPFSPLRIKAAKLFAESELFVEAGTSRRELERQVVDVMGVMEPGYLKEQSDGAKAMRRLLLAGGMVVAAATDEVRAEEVTALEGLLGEGTITDKLDVEALRAAMPRRMADVVELCAPSRRAQVLRDLCVIALADGEVSAAERAALEEVAQGLDLPVESVDIVLRADLDLD